MIHSTDSKHENADYSTILFFEDVAYHHDIFKKQERVKKKDL